MYPVDLLITYIVASCGVENNYFERGANGGALISHCGSPYFIYQIDEIQWYMAVDTRPSRTHDLTAEKRLFVVITFCFLSSSSEPSLMFRLASDSVDADESIRVHVIDFAISPPLNCIDFFVIAHWPSARRPFLLLLLTSFCIRVQGNSVGNVIRQMCPFGIFGQSFSGRLANRAHCQVTLQTTISSERRFNLTRFIHLLNLTYNHSYLPDCSSGYSLDTDY